MKMRVPKRLVSFDDPMYDFVFKKPRLSGISRPPRNKYVIVHALGSPKRKGFDEVIPEMENILQDFDKKYKEWSENKTR